LPLSHRARRLQDEKESQKVEKTKGKGAFRCGGCCFSVQPPSIVGAHATKKWFSKMANKQDLVRNRFITVFGKK